MNKIKTYIGFAKKSRAIVFGEENVLKTKNPKIILCAQDLSQNTLKKLAKFENINLLSQSSLQELEIQSKVVAITDKSLADAIQNNIEEFGGKNFDYKQSN